MTNELINPGQHAMESSRIRFVESFGTRKTGQTIMHSAKMSPDDDDDR